MRALPTKSLERVINEWDALAAIRFDQISSGIDITFNHVLAPYIMSRMPQEKVDCIIDAGCGVGVLTQMMAVHASRIIGVDPSIESIKIAKDNFGTRCSYVHSTLEEYSEHNQSSADIVVANMVLMDVLNLDAFVLSCAKLLKRCGKLIFTVTHPFFWSHYYGYSKKDWYRYEAEIIIEDTFKITAQQDCRLISTHVHRPLSTYVDAFGRAGLLISQLDEPSPSKEVEILYNKAWKFPRYLVGECTSKK